jgi:hypothetical protein
LRFAARFIVRDGSKQALAYVYFENEAGRRSGAKLLTRDEAFPDRGEHRQAAKRAAADIEGHSPAAELGQPRLIQKRRGPLITADVGSSGLFDVCSPI